MEYFRPGFRELQRIVLRTAHRVRLVLVRRRLKAAETELGLLGWQQADFDEATEQQVDQIHHVEREQGRLHNAGAELALKIQALADERKRVREEYEGQRAQLEPERDRVRATRTELGARLATLRKNEAERVRRVEVIAEEQLKLRKQHNDLLAIQPQTPQIRDELISARGRQLAFEEELSDLEKQHDRLAAELEKGARELAELAQRNTTFDHQLRELTAAAETAGGKLASEARELEKQKTRLAADLEKLESEKVDSYREIGRVLADSGVAPANQPEALSRVQTLRQAVQYHNAAIAASRGLTAHEDRTQLSISFVLIAIVVLALALLIGAVF